MINKKQRSELFYRERLFIADQVETIRLFGKTASEITDSVILTTTNNRDKLRSVTINVNARYAFNNNNELTADFDFLGYRINNNPFFNNRLDEPGGYSEDITGNIPSTINILTGKADYSANISKGLKI